MTELDLTLGEDGQLLSDAARQLIDERAPASRLRQLRDDPRGWSLELWRELGELGWIGAQLPEASGGAGLSFLDAALLQREAGRQLAPEPLWSTGVLGAELLRARDPSDARLAALCAGELIVAPAWHEPGLRGGLAGTRATASRTARGWRLTGRKELVPDGMLADVILVVAAAEGGLGVWAVPPDAAGLHRERQHLVDGRPAGVLAMAVDVDPDALVIQPGDGALAIAVDRARVALAAEQLGAAEAAFELTVAWLGERVQFGVPIGSFQTLQHRAARLYLDLALTRSAVIAAARAADDALEELPALASLAKATAGDTLHAVAREAIQMHGGVGMTDECDVGFYLKRWLVSEHTLGDAGWHRDRWATLHGY